MPELPEVETTRRGIEPWVVGQRLHATKTYNAALRWPVQSPDLLNGCLVKALTRRGKYLLFEFDVGTLIVHLGMSGSLRVLDEDTPLLKHDHFEMVIGESPRRLIRLNDPRRFGCVRFHSVDALEPHPLLAHLGIEPLSNEFGGSDLFRRSRNRKVAVKNFIMDSKVVVGVGNIYAAESLFLAGMRPTVPAGRVSRRGYDALAQAIQRVLANAIRQGGTTLRDFVGSDGNPGYFRQYLYVYGRGGELCRVCETALKETVIGGRSTVHCNNCQRRTDYRPPVGAIV